MSIESLLLLLFLVGIPLAERLKSWLRERAEAGPAVPDRPAPRGRSTARQPAGDAGWETPLEVLPPPLPLPPPPAPRHPAPVRLRAHEAGGARPAQQHQAQQTGRVTPATRAPTRARRGRLGSVKDLRRAVVMMTILGPCRALDATDASDRPW